MVAQGVKVLTFRVLKFIAKSVQFHEAVQVVYGFQGVSVVQVGCSGS